jgi:dipeptidyl aminopeptidase/acylaminoacyl peptidase
MKLKYLPRIVVSLIFSVVVLSTTISHAEEPYPLEYFALRDVMTNVRVSPDGSKIAFLKIPDRTGNAVLEVHETADLEKDPLVLNADPMELRSFYWASDKQVIISARQKVRDKIDGFNQGVYESKLAILDVELEELDTFDMQNPSVEELLPNDPNHIIVSMQPGGSSGKQKIAEPFRPRAYYKFNLDKGTKQLLIRGKLDTGNIDFDNDGEPRFARGFDIGAKEYLWFIRPKGENGWQEIFRMHEDSFETFTIQGDDPQVPGNLLVTANNGHDKVGLWSFNPNTRSFDELLYRRNDVDVAGVRRHSNGWMRPDEIVGVAYRKDKLHFEYYDEEEGAMYKYLEELVPFANDVRITSRSRDGEVATVYNSGPQDPGTYYLYNKGEFVMIGGKQPLLSGDDLAKVKYITYKARDGRKIPAFVTIPKGKPPFPLVVMPHGGPFVGETVGYDEWGQMLANNGYLVLQPSYRGSTGYGIDFYTTAFINGGQGGYQMQDDKDDGAMYLVEKGYADPDRLALFGWSYGGYAALVAASRTPQIYQCVLAGAAVSDPIMQVNYYRDRARGAGLIEQVNMWTESISPLDEVEKVNVPLLLIHGSVDQRVPPVHAKKYRKALEKYGKEFDYLELDGADHFSSTLFYRHQIELYTSMIDYLANDCGPNGLADNLSAAASE